MHLALVAGWLVGVLAVSELVRISRANAAERARVQQEDDDRRRNASGWRWPRSSTMCWRTTSPSSTSRPGWPCTCWTSTRNRRARPWPPSRRRAATPCTSCGAALDVLRRGEDALEHPRRRWPISRRWWGAVHAGGLDVRRGSPTIAGQPAGRGPARRLPDRAGIADERAATPGRQKPRPCAAAQRPRCVDDRGRGRRQGCCARHRRRDGGRHGTHRYASAGRGPGRQPDRGTPGRGGFRVPRGPTAPRRTGHLS